MRAMMRKVRAIAAVRQMGDIVGFTLLAAGFLVLALLFFGTLFVAGHFTFHLTR
jgi:uncharacterized membrane protein YbhN (UPF0104 family)